MRTSNVAFQADATFTKATVKPKSLLNGNRFFRFVLVNRVIMVVYDDRVFSVLQGRSKR